MSKFRNKKDNELLDSLAKCQAAKIGLENVLFDFVDHLYFNKNEPIKVDTDEAIKQSNK